MFWAIVSVVFLIVGIVCGLKNAENGTGDYDPLHTTSYD